jgi:hypothetical protein
MATQVTPHENGLDVGARDVAIVGVQDRVARDVVIGGVLGLGCIKTIGIRELAAWELWRERRVCKQWDEQAMFSK